MSEEFVPDTREISAVPACSEPASCREPVKILIIGSPKGVNNMIQTLYRHRFAEVKEWSALQPTAKPGEVVSIIIRQVSINC